MKIAKVGILACSLAVVVNCSSSNGPSFPSLPAPTGGGGGAGSGGGAGGGGPVKPLPAGTSVRDAGKYIGILFTQDLPGEPTDYIRDGRWMPYRNAAELDVGIGAEKQYCIFRPQGNAKKGKLLKLVSVKQGRVATPARFFEGVTFEFEGGVKLSAPGGMSSPADELIKLCLYDYAVIRQFPAPPPFEKLVHSPAQCPKTKGAYSGARRQTIDVNTTPKGFTMSLSRSVDMVADGQPHKQQDGDTLTGKCVGGVVYFKVDSRTNPGQIEVKKSGEQLIITYVEGNEVFTFEPVR